MTSLLGVKNQFVPLRVFSLKMSTAGAFAVPLSLLSWKKYNGIWYSLNWYLLGVKNNSSHRIFSVIGGSFPNFCQELLSFLNGNPPPGGCSCKVPLCFSLLNSIVMWVVFWQHWTGWNKVVRVAQCECNLKEWQLRCVPCDPCITAENLLLIENNIV